MNKHDEFSFLPSFFPYVFVPISVIVNTDSLLNMLLYLFAWKYIRFENFTVINTPDPIKVPLSFGFSENVEDIML